MRGWMDIFKSKGRFAQGGTKHINKPTTHKERTQGITPCALSFCLYIRKGKSNNKDKAGKTRQEDKPRSNKGKAPKAGQKDKTKGKKDKKEGKRIKRQANTPQAPKPPNHSRTQKPRKPRKASE